MQVLYGREYQRKALDPRAFGFQPEDSRRCVGAVEKFLTNPGHPSLNFERLGSGSRQNHWSIRASRELRVILAADPASTPPSRVALLNMGHHDAMYDWARRQRHYTDLDAYGTVWALPGSASKGDSAVPPDDFEEWMLYLPAQQRRLVNRHYHAGLGRIRGAAGTGKTVVALHRAAVLGRRYPKERILATTFSRSLSGHMEALFRRFPDAPDNVHFANIDRLAYRFDPRPLKLDDVDAAFEAAYLSTVPAQARQRLDRDYLKEEVRRIIKGRDAQKEEYLDTGRFERLGRKRAFKRQDREICWNLREAWDREMAQRDTVDFADRLVEARNRAQAETERSYRAAVVDEAQDLTLVGIQLVRALVAGRPRARLRRDSILMLDDAAQRIYPGGFRPAWANLNFAGHSDTLVVNFRNTRRIFQAARAVRGEVVVSRDANDDGSVDAVRFESAEGDRPVMMVAQRTETGAILDRIHDLVGNEGFTHNEIGVLVLRNRDAERLVVALENRNVPCVNLKDLRDGPLADGVRIGTFDRAKGMEFRAVFIPRLGESRFPIDTEDRRSGQLAIQIPGNQPAPPAREVEEERLLNLDRLYVAMTRARDRLYLIADEQPCEEIQRARDHHFS